MKSTIYKLLAALVVLLITVIITLFIISTNAIAADKPSKKTKKSKPKTVLLSLDEQREWIRLMEWGEQIRLGGPIKPIKPVKKKREGSSNE